MYEGITHIFISLPQTAELEVATKIYKKVFFYEILKLLSTITGRLVTLLLMRGKKRNLF